MRCAVMDVRCHPTLCTSIISLTAHCRITIKHQTCEHKQLNIILQAPSLANSTTSLQWSVSRVWCDAQHRLWLRVPNVGSLPALMPGRTHNEQTMDGVCAPNVGALSLLFKGEASSYPGEDKMILLWFIRSGEIRSGVGKNKLWKTDVSGIAGLRDVCVIIYIAWKVKLIL